MGASYTRKFDLSTPYTKKFFDLVYIDKFRKLEYNTINEQRRSWIGKVYPVGERLCFFIFVRKD